VEVVARLLDAANSRADKGLTALHLAAQVDYTCLNAYTFCNAALNSYLDEGSHLDSLG
jgi:hypothetical protein